MASVAILIAIIAIIISFVHFRRKKSSSALNNLRMNQNAVRLDFRGRENILDIDTGIDGTDTRILCLLADSPSESVRIIRGRCRKADQGMTISTDQKRSFSIIHSPNLDVSMLLKEDFAHILIAIFGKPKLVQSFYYNKPTLYIDGNMVVFIANSKAKPGNEQINYILEIMYQVAEIVR